MVKKTWVAPELEVLEVSETAFINKQGPKFDLFDRDGYTPPGGGSNDS
jgi:hypothetical protein